MEQYNYAFIEMDPISLFTLKNKGNIFQTRNGELVYCASNIENLNIDNEYDKYLVIIKKEKRYNVLSEPNHIFVENTNDYVENHVINTEWTCIWIEPEDSEVYENYYTTIEAFNLAQKIENRFFNSISLKSIYKDYNDWFYGYYEFPYHINNSMNKKVEERKDKKDMDKKEISECPDPKDELESSYFLPSSWSDLNDEDYQ